MKQVIVSASINKSDLPVSAPFKPKNAVILTGDLTAKADGEFVITTKNIGYKRGSTEPLEFVEEHPVRGDAAAFDLNTKLTVTGFIGRVPRGTQMIHRLIAVGISATPAAKYDNRVMVAGRAIMANDPHRAYSAPSLRYIAHISAPGLNVFGAGEPALPGSIGHNGTIAFGLTIFNIDQ